MLLAQYNEEFKEDFKDQIEKNMTDNQDIVIKTSTSDKDDSKSDTSKKLIFKNIFQILVKKCHPDKVTGSDEQFKDLKKACEKYEIMSMFNIAERYHLLNGIFDILYPSFYADVICYMSDDVIELEKDIDQLKKTFAWRWAHRDREDDDELKAHIIRGIDGI